MIRLIKRFIRTYKRFGKAYVAVDIHETVLKPTYNKHILSSEFYPFAKRTLQLMTEDPDTNLILWTSSTKTDIKKYLEYFESNNIIFMDSNKNPECEESEFACFDDKWYFDVGLDDRCGFIPYIDWIVLYIYFWFRRDNRYY